MSTHRASSFRLVTDRVRRFYIWSYVLAVLLALMAALQLATPARADCDAAGIWDTTKDSMKTTEVCEPVCENNYECYATAALAIVLTEVAHKKGQNPVGLFCSTLKSNLGEILGDLQLVGDLTDDQISELSDLLQGAGEALAIVNCACATEVLNLKIESSFGECADAVLEAVGCGDFDFSTAIITGCTPGGDVIGGALNDGINALVDLGCKFIFNCDEANGTAGPPNTQCAEFGTQADSNGVCHYCKEFGPHVITQTDGSCGCEPPYDAIRIGKRLALCQCTSPKTVVDGRCLCPTGQQLKGDVCVACSTGEKYVPYHTDTKGNTLFPSCEICPMGWHQAENDPTKCVPGWSCDAKKGEVPDKNTYGHSCITCKDNQRVAKGAPIFDTYCADCAAGQKASADHQQCIPQCASGWITNTGMSPVNPATGTAGLDACIRCQVNEYAGYDKQGSSIGKCLPCASGTTSPAGAIACTPLTCGPSGYQDPDNSHACKSCPATQIYIPTTKQIVTKPGGQSTAVVVAGHCGCGDNQKLEGGTCVCATDAIKTNLPQVGNSVFACSCPTGSHLDADKFACVCGDGTKPQDGKCPVVLEKAKPLVKDCTVLGANYINNPANAAACTRCPTGLVANAGRTACVRIPVQVLPRGQPTKPTLRCPPRTRRNAAGTACVPLGRPGPLAPGERRIFGAPAR